MIRPEKLPPNQFDHFYKGGNRIGMLRHGPGGPMRPEEWIGSTTTRFGEATQGLSHLENGQLLVEAIVDSPLEWLGAEHVKAFGTSTELLVKLLDPDQRLPVHFHPNKRFAKTHLALDHGKTEAWIILETHPGAGVGLGFKEKMSKSSVQSMVDKRDSRGLLNSLVKYEVSVGDAVLVPAGTPHSIDAGIFVLELQEPTDLSALLEWEGFAVDGRKDGHLGLGYDLVLDALFLDPLPEHRIQELITHDRFSAAGNVPIFTESADPYFRADYVVSAEEKIDPGFAILLILEGAGSVSFEQSSPLTISRGDALVIPWQSGSWTLHGCRGIVCRPPLPNDASNAV
jgi:mannose-6-phosphate isomerase